MLRQVKDAGELLRAYGKKRAWRVLVCGLTCAVVFCSLIVPGYAAESTPNCQLSQHTHGAECYELVCIPGDAVTHEHSEACYGGNLICRQQEHAHILICYSNRRADYETEEQWEATFAHVELTGDWSQDVIQIAETQLGYKESKRNYSVEADGVTKKGYTRYGEWYGLPKADWCGMFVSFCMHYAGVQDTPQNYWCGPWVEELSSQEYDLYRDDDEYIPSPGDLIFFDYLWDGIPDHVGLVAEIHPATESEPVRIRTIEGNSLDRVRYRNYYLNNPYIMGYADMAAAQERYERKISEEAAQAELLPAEEEPVEEAVLLRNVTRDPKQHIHSLAAAEDSVGEHVAVQESRTEHAPEKRALTVTAEAARIDPVTVASLLAVPMLFMALPVRFLWLRKRFISGQDVTGK